MRKFVVFLVLFSMISISIFQFGSTNAIALEENKRDYSQMDERLVPYQMIVDEINEEYGMSIESCESYVERMGYEKLLSISLEDYKNTLLKDVEFVKKMQKEYEEAIAKVPSDAVWYKCSPREGYLETIKDYIYPNSNVISENSIIQNDEIICNDNVDFVMDFRDKVLITEQGIVNPFGNVVFLIKAQVNVSGSYCYYDSIDDFSSMLLTNTIQVPNLFPYDMEYSFTDGKRAATVTWLCNYLDEYGSFVGSNIRVVSSLFASGDCFYNYPDYYITHDYSTKDFESIISFDNSKNCAGYALGINSYITNSNLGISQMNLNACNSISTLKNMYRNKFCLYMAANSIPYQIVSNYDGNQLSGDQYVVVMRVGWIDSNNNGIVDETPIDDYDFHWMVQLGDGSWADKRGSFPSRIIPNSTHYYNPLANPWNIVVFGEIQNLNYYYSDPVYFIIG